MDDYFELLKIATNNKLSKEELVKVYNSSKHPLFFGPETFEELGSVLRNALKNKIDETETINLLKILLLDKPNIAIEYLSNFYLTSRHIKISLGLIKVKPKFNAEAISSDNFGYDVNNPIPSEGISGTKFYLNHLRSITNEILHFSRLGSIYSDTISHPIDAYELKSNSSNFSCKLYINIYAGYNTIIAPKGLIYVE